MALADIQTMPDASDLADASVAPSPPQPVMPMPTGPPVDVVPPGPSIELPPRPVLKLPTLARSGAAGPPSGETAANATLDPIAAAAAAAASSSNPHAMAAAAHFASMRQAATMPSVKPMRGKKKRRSRRPMVVKVLVLGLLGGAGYLGRDTAFATRLKGDGYDSSILPMIVYERPNPGTVDGTLILDGVWSQDGVAATDELFVDFINNPTTGDERREFRQTRRSIEDGETIDPPMDATSWESISLEESTYREPHTEGGAWQQSPRNRDAWVSKLSNIWMYQDVIDHSLRRVTPVTVTDETIGGVEVTTYLWSIPIGEYRTSAPFVAARLPLPELETSDSLVTLTISVDSAGLVRVLEVALELDAVIDYANEQTDSIHFYRLRFELDSIDDATPTITAPTNTEPAPTDGAGG